MSTSASPVPAAAMAPVTAAAATTTTPPRAKRQREDATAAVTATEEEEERPTYETRMAVDSGEALRVVRPYVNVYRASAKKRWFGKTILETYRGEYKERVERYWERAVQGGLIRVNGNAVPSSFVVVNGQSLSHATHRHEPPVAFASAKEMVAFEDENVVVVNKPGSVPVHPSGAYRFNSITNILRFEGGYESLHTVHRLDRLTSGLLVLAKNADAARSLSDLIQRHDGSVRKFYVAKVSGKFPASLREFDESERSKPCRDAGFGGSSSESSTTNTNRDDEAVRLSVPPPGYAFQDDVLSFSFPLAVLDHRRGLHACDLAKGKPSLSRFRLLAYDPDSNTSVVRCEPVTGRTHQLRLHLQRLGFPIANDPIYGAPFSSSAPSEVGGGARAPDGSPAAANADAEEEAGGEDAAPVALSAAQLALQGVSSESLADTSIPLETRLRSVCAHCVGRDYEDKLYEKPIWLHALQYLVLSKSSVGVGVTSVAREWRVPLPTWARGVADADAAFVVVPPSS